MAALELQTFVDVIDAGNLLRRYVAAVLLTTNDFLICPLEPTG
jgi:hypothetical protein